MSSMSFVLYESRFIIFIIIIKNKIKTTIVKQRSVLVISVRSLPAKLINFANHGWRGWGVVGGFKDGLSLITLLLHPIAYSYQYTHQCTHQVEQIY